MRIGVVSSWPSEPSRGSGTATAVLGLVRGLEELGHEVERIAPPEGGSPDIGRRLAFNLALPLRSRRLLRTLDLVVGVDLDGVCLRPVVPYVVCLKGVAADEALHESGAPALALRAAARLEARNARRADVVVVPSAYSGREAARRYRLHPEKIAVVPEAASLPPAGGAAPPEVWSDAFLRGSRAGKPTILCVARHYPRKHTELLLRAIVRLRNPIPDVRVRVVGDGPELPRLRELTRRLGVTDHVTFLGTVGAARLRAEYERAWCFCLPSEQEAYGIVFVEAMAAGLPVVGVRSAAVPEVVEHDRTGLLVAPGDADALAGSLARILTSPGLREAMGRAGREVAAGRTPRAHAVGLLRAVGTILSGGHPASPGSLRELRRDGLARRDPPSPPPPAGRQRASPRMTGPESRTDMEMPRKGR